MADAVGVGLHLRQVDAQVERAGADGGAGEDGALFALRVLHLRGRPGRSIVPRLGPGLHRGGGLGERARRLDHFLDAGVLRLILLGGLRLRGGGGRRLDRVRHVGGVGLDHHQRRADRDLVADRAGQRDDGARHRRLHLHRRLVGHHVGDVLVFLDPVADRDVPGDDLRLGDALADVGQLEGETGHQGRVLVSASAVTWRILVRG